MSRRIYVCWTVLERLVRAVLFASRGQQDCFWTFSYNRPILQYGVRTCVEFHVIVRLKVRCVGGRFVCMEGLLLSARMSRAKYAGARDGIRAPLRGMQHLVAMILAS